MADFFDKVREGLDKGVTVVSVRSKEALEAARIKSKIGDLADQKAQSLAELGSMVYASYQQGLDNLDEKAKERCVAIAAMDEEIKNKEAELRQVHLEAKKELGIPLCACGADLAEDDVFCRKCGQKVVR